jgi:hypothetical protein
MVSKPTDSEQEKWNKILANEGLSVWEGTDHHLVYMEQLTSTRSTHPRSFVDPTRSAGDSDTRIYEQMAIAVLTDRERKFLDCYQSKAVPEVARLYDISVHAVYCRIGAIRRKINLTTKSLIERQ